MKKSVRTYVAALAVAIVVPGLLAGQAFAQDAGAAPCKPRGQQGPRDSEKQKVHTGAPNVEKGSPLFGLPGDKYKVEYDWAKMPAGRPWNGTSAINIDRDGKSVWTFMRCSGNCMSPKNVKMDTIYKFDSNGNILKSFGAGMFASAHGIYVDPKDNIWVVDGSGSAIVPCGPQVGGDSVREFSPDGKLLMTLGTPGKKGDGPNEFNGPTGVVLAPNGDIFVSDGHGNQTNHRVVKFDKTGKFIKSWGTAGHGPMEFDTPHAITMDKEGRLYVADRSNKPAGKGDVPSSVKVFDQDGKLLKILKQFGEPSGVWVDKNDVLWVADPTSIEEDAKNGFYNPGFTPGIRWGSVKDYKVVGSIPYGYYNTLEGVAVDDNGTIYGANTQLPRAVRWTKN